MKFRFLFPKIATFFNLLFDSFFGVRIMNRFDAIGHNIAEKYIEASNARNVDGFMSLLAKKPQISRIENGRVSQLYGRRQIKKAFGRLLPIDLFTMLETKIVDDGLRPRIFKKAILNKGDGTEQLQKIESTLYIEENPLSSKFYVSNSDSDWEEGDSLYIKKPRPAWYQIIKVVTKISITHLAPQEDPVSPQVAIRSKD